MTRAELAELLRINPSRVSQLVTAGVLHHTTDGKSFDTGASLLAFLHYLQRNEPQVAARLRLQTAAAARNERRQRVALSQLVTLREVQALVEGAFGPLMDSLQAGTQAVFLELDKTVGEQKARQLTYGVYHHVLATLHAYRASAIKALEELRRELHHDERLDGVVQDIFRAVSRDDTE